MRLIVKLQKTKRHRNYFFLGMYLRECTECFGMEDPYLTTSRQYQYNQFMDRFIVNQKLVLYHGINKYFTFTDQLVRLQIMWWQQIFVKQKE